MQHVELASISGNDRIALRGVRIGSHLSGMSQKTVIEQMFVNQEDRSIEAVYTFPLPDGSAVCGFEVITGDRVLTGTIDETEKAIEKYDEAIEQGHGAFMVEADRPDVFTARVGNLKPHQSATIRLTYVAPLDRVDKQIRVTFPTTIAPRYVSAQGMDPLEAAVEGDALNPPKALHVPYGLSLEVDVDLKRKINAITSSTHAIRISAADASSPSPGTPGEGRGEGLRQSPHPNPSTSRSPRTMEYREREQGGVSLPEYWERGQSFRVLLDGAMTQMDRDVVITIDLAKEHEPVAQVARGPDGAPYVAVSFIPEFDVDELADPMPTETIFVLDCSGSMMGSSIHQATHALELCLRSLNPGDTFNICRFGSTFEMMASEPLVYSDATLRQALNHINRIVDLGGTELMTPLMSIFQRKPAVGRVRNLVLLTDGQVNNEHGLIEWARQYRDQNRIFSFGIGAASSSFLMKGLARATNGAAEFISGNERIEDKVLRTFGRIASPMVRDVSINWGNADVQTLAEIPPVFDGDVLTVFGRVEGSPPKSIALECIACGGAKMSWSVDVPQEHEDGGVISTMWARRTIQSLEEVNDIRRYPQKKDKKRVRDQIVRLSKQFNLLSSVTTFIAIEHRSIEERNEGKPALRKVPVMMAAEWGGSAVTRRISGPAAAAMPMLCEHLAPPAAPAQSIDKTMDRSIDRLRDSSEPAFARRARQAGLGRFLKGFIPQRDASFRDSISLDHTGHVEPDQLLLGLQSADGWFDWKRDLIASIQPSWREWDRAVRDAIRVGFREGEAPAKPLPRGAEAQREHRPPGHAPHRVTPGRPTSSSDRFVHTVLALLIFQQQFPGREPIWRRAARKARLWLAKEAGVDAQQMVAWLSELQMSINKAPAP
jgi:Ca-activated chloride channel family protein